MAASRSPADQASDAARWWRAYDLAKNDQADELRALAAAGDDHARRHLASWLSDGDHLDELGQRVAAGGYHALQELARRLAERNMAGELRDLAVAADPGDRPLILRAARD